ncbi:unnamed protein product [Symbiodinium microadriaticum]|nr:unnamed protein product [Symbiodinium microadriaticum]
MFSGCCCTDSQDSQEAQFNLPIASDEKTIPYLATDRRIATSKDVPSARSTRSLTPEEKEAEKVRLQGLVNNFAKKAVRGCPCVYFKEGTATRFETQYRIDKSLEYLILVNPQEPGVTEVACPIAAIQDIYSMAEDGSSCFPPEVIAALGEEDRERLLMIVFSDTDGKLFRFCLVEESTESRDTFLECMRQAEKPREMLFLLLLQAMATSVSADASCLMQTSSPDRKALPQGPRLRTGEAAAPNEAFQQLAFSARGLVETLATLQRRLRHRVRISKSACVLGCEAPKRGGLSGEALSPFSASASLLPRFQANATAMPTNFIAKYQRLSPNKTLVMWVVVLTPVWFLVGWCLLRLEMNRPIATSVRERRDRPEARGWNFH